MRLYNLSRVKAAEELPDVWKAIAKRRANVKGRELQDEAAIESEDRKRIEAFKDAYRGYPGRFKRRLGDRESDRATCAAAETLFELNRFAKHDGAPSDEIYSLKNRLLERFWDAGFCIEAGVARSRGKRLDPSVGNEYWALRFEIGESIYSWHQPKAYAPWAEKRGGSQAHEVVAEEKGPKLTSKQVKDGLALLYWFLGEL